MQTWCDILHGAAVQDNDAKLSLKEMKDSVAAIFKVCWRTCQ
jgi:hypothetical protein